MPPPASPTPPEIVARLEEIENDEVRAVLEELLNGDASAPVSLARLLLSTDSLEEVASIQPKLIALVAARVGATRLIDNEVMELS